MSLGAFYCPHCGTENACSCDACKPRIKEGEYVNTWTEDGNLHICGKCNKTYSPDQALEEEYKRRKQEVCFHKWYKPFPQIRQYEFKCYKCGKIKWSDYENIEPI